MVFRTGFDGLEPMKPIESLLPADLATSPVWRFVSSAGSDETWVQPVRRLPVSSLSGKMVATEVTLANGKRVWALIGNVDVNDPRLTQHFLTLSIERDGRWFRLARYHDHDYSTHGPEALASFLALPVDVVFPIAYDVRQYSRGKPAALAGEVHKEPRERLTRSQLIALAVP
jgi:hypothetical protein